MGVPFQSDSSGHLAQGGRCCPTGRGLPSCRQSVTTSSERSRTFQCASMPTQSDRSAHLALGLACMAIVTPRFGCRCLTVTQAPRRYCVYCDEREVSEERGVAIQRETWPPWDERVSRSFIVIYSEDLFICLLMFINTGYDHVSSTICWSATS